MEKVILILVFLAIRYFITSAAKKRKNKPVTPKPTAKKQKDLQDILGDFLDQVEPPKKPKTAPVSNTDTHKAEEDTHKKIDWQEVRRSKITEKEELLKADNRKSKKTRISKKLDTLNTMNSEEIEEDDILEEIDLRKAVIYKEILERKYFSI